MALLKMNTPMTVEHATELLGCSRQGLADALGVSKVAVSQWHKRGSIPLAREYQVRDIASGKEPIKRMAEAA